MNGLTVSVQTFATGTAGTDFGISSSGSTHTFNLPSATVTNRGLLTSADWTTFKNKQDAVTSSMTIASGSTSTALQDGLVVLPYNTGGGQTGELRFRELAAQGTNYVGFKAPDALAGSGVWTLPSTDGTLGQVLATNGTQALGWATRVATVSTIGALNTTGSAVNVTLSVNQASAVQGGIINTNAQTLAGTKTFQDGIVTQSVTLSATRTGYVGVDSFGYSPMNSGGAYTRLSSPGYIYSTGSGEGNLLTSVYGLPDGSTVTGISCYFYDNSDTANHYMTALLYAHNRTTGTGTQVGTVTTSAWSASTSITEATTGTSHLVDHSLYSYGMRLRTHDVACDTNCRQYSCRLTYTQDTL